ncbi:hypothetical protein, partial [Streptomyces acidiscabies]|uniref:hypothetical protein n=1 Tax=Streptomyces acidiscabies TaxID=42234 RepID=UPI0038F818A8
YALASKQNFVTYGSYFGVGLDCAYLSKTLELTAPIPEDRPMPRNLLHSNFLFSLIRNNIGKLPLANKLTAPRDKDTTADALTPAILAGAAAPVDA